MSETDLIHDADAGIDRLLLIMARLRDPETGCPWDIEQSFGTIAPYTLEEAYEVADAVDREAWDELPGELGDLLLQVVFMAQIAKDLEKFDFQCVVRAISDKMVDRHPHVFGTESRDKTADQQTRDWEVAKAAERAGRGEKATLDGVAMGLPALTRALKLQKRLGRVGFDWKETGPVLEKISEEIGELEDAQSRQNASETEAEFGDLLFALVNLARHWEIDPEAALRRTNAKVERRFKWVEARLAEDGKGPSDSNLDEMDALWDAAKAAEAP
ncbi:MAG: nucleoside triphosphate pyrophosphohydrolase [Pseudomonadota bacterium]